jgi:hypothetical protein
MASNRLSRKMEGALRGQRVATLKTRGRPTSFKPEYIEQVKKLCAYGHTDLEIAEFFDVSLRTFAYWKVRNSELMHALKAGKAAADARVERSLYQKAVGYSYDAVKIFMPAGAKAPIYAPYVEHVPPDTTAAIFWLKNRDPQNWRDAWQIEAAVGKYIISDRPMTPEDWIRERATIVDAEATEVLPPALPEPRRDSEEDQ